MATSVRTHKVWAMLLILCLRLSGCGGGGKDKVSFMVFGDPAELAAYQKLVAAFEAKYPGIQVELRHVASQGGYQKQLVENFQWDGETWCVPQNVASLVVYYAGGLFDAVGLPYPDEGWTRDDFLQT